MYCSSEAFPKLIFLKLGWLPNIEKWRVDAGAFPNLSTLKIESCKSFEKWSVDAGAFPNLSTLEIGNCKSFEKWSVDAGAFPKLSTLLIDEYKYVEIVPHGLTRITFERDYRASKLEKSFPDVKKLLLYPSLHNLVPKAPIGKFPRYEPQFCADLVSLELIYTEFEEDPMPFLQELPNLRTLTFDWDAYVGKEMYCSSKAFPKLTFLKIDHLRSIKKWRVDAGAFPNLKILIINNCNSFEIVPHGLIRITSLVRINIEDMPKEFRIKYGRLQNTNQ